MEKVPKRVMVDLFVVQGIVTEVDPVLLCFEVAPDVEGKHQLVPSTVTVHTVFLFINNPEQKLPAVGARVVLKSQFFKCEEFHTFVVLRTPEEFTEPVESTPFVNVAKRLRFTSSKLLLVASNYKKLKKVPRRADVILGALQTLGNWNFELQLLSKLTYVSNEAETYKDFSYWTFGNHWNWGNGERRKYLVGHFLMGKVNIHFTDSVRQVPCVFTNNKNNEIVDFFNCYVLIKEFTVCTEIYNSNKFATMEYLIIDASQVVNLNIKQNSTPLWVERPFTTPFRLTFQVVSKSQKIAFSKNQVGYWLHARAHESVYLFRVTTSPEHDVFPFLQLGHFYNVFYEDYPTKTWDGEVEKLRNFDKSLKSATCHALPPNPHFAPATLPSESPQLINVQEALEALQRGNLVSFEAVIQMKLFMDPMSSRTSARTDDASFGTPGHKTHKLVFDCNGRRVELYLNNWENLGAPFGLIPNMRVSVRNVLPQKGKYYKSTVFTSFEIIRYEPPLRFESANLCNQSWGEPYFLGSGKLIPNSTVIWGKINSFCIISLKFQGNNAVISFVSTDAKGEFKVVAKEKAAQTLLRVLLGLGEAPFDQWFKGVVALGGYSFCRQRAGRNLAETVLDEVFMQLESRSCAALKCRKMDIESEKEMSTEMSDKLAAVTSAYKNNNDLQELKKSLNEIFLRKRHLRRTNLGSWLLDQLELEQ